MRFIKQNHVLRTGKSVSLVKSLQLWLSLFVLIVMALSLAGLTSFAYGFARDERAQVIGALGSAISKMSARSISLGDYLGLEEVLLGAQLPDFICQIEVTNADSSSIAHVNGKSPICRSSKSFEAMSFPIQDYSSGNAIGAGTALGHVILSVDHSQLQEKFARIAYYLFFGGVVFLLVFIVLGNLSVTRSFSPLAQAVEAAGKEENFESTVIARAPVEIRPLLKQIDCLYKSRAQVQSDARIGQIAAQVAHDIRSPLSALRMAESYLVDVAPETRVVFQTALRRINDIVDELTSVYRQEKKLGSNFILAMQKTHVHVASLIEEIVKEKKMQFLKSPDLEIIIGHEPDSSNAFVNAGGVELKRVLSNLLNNAIEAMEYRGKVLIRTIVTSSKCEILVQDNGPGISKENLLTLGKRGVTLNKKDGNGLGLYHARTTVESLGGAFGISSKIGEGTVVKVELPLSDVPEWMQLGFSTSALETLVAVDDDPAIHEIWKQKVGSNTEFRGNLIQLKSPSDFLEWWESAPCNVCVKFAIDLEFANSELDGLDLIERLQIADRSILVTSRYDDLKVIERCQKLNVKMMPKILLGELV